MVMHNGGQTEAKGACLAASLPVDRGLREADASKPQFNSDTFPQGLRLENSEQWCESAERPIAGGLKGRGR